MTEARYSELKYDGQIYTEQWKIDEILIKNKFNWMVNAEIKNARLEIFQDTLIWNAGLWYNGDWYFGVWRDGEWRYGRWQNGVWYNGTWRDGIFESGIIYKGKFFKGKIEGGEIRGGQFISIEISPNVTEYTEDEFQEKQQETTIQEKKEHKMKHLKTFEGYNNAENAGLYDQMSEFLDRANILVCKYNDEDPDKWEFGSPDEALDSLSDIDSDSEFYDEAQELYNEIDSLNDEMEAEEYFENEDDED